MATRGVPHFLTLDWLGSSIRICTAYSGRYKPRMAWAPWDTRWPQKLRDEVDLKLKTAVLKGRT